MEFNIKGLIQKLLSKFNFGSYSIEDQMELYRLSWKKGSLYKNRVREMKYKLR
jgi:hypothetical protein